MNSTTATRFRSNARPGQSRSVRSLLASAIDKFGDAGPIAAGVARGSFGGGAVTSGLSRADRDVVASSADLRRFLKRILLRVGEKWKDRVVAKQRQLDLIDTTLSIRDWKVKFLSDDGRFDDRVALTNRAPYLLYMHPKGTSKTRTFLNTDMPPIARLAKAELVDELIIFKRSPVFQKAAKARILAGLR